jgi:hypothetical protein
VSYGSALIDAASRVLLLPSRRRAGGAEREPCNSSDFHQSHRLIIRPSSLDLGVRRILIKTGVTIKKCPPHHLAMVEDWPHILGDRWKVKVTPGGVSVVRKLWAGSWGHLRALALLATCGILRSSCRSVSHELTPSFAGARSANRSAKLVENLEIFSYIHQVIKMKETAKNVPEIESVQRIEHARLEEVPEAISDAVAELSAASAKLGHSLHPRTATSLSGTVRIMNTYYSNLMEGHNTRPKDIERALAGQFDKDSERRNLQIEAAAHVRVQAELDRMDSEHRLPADAASERRQRPARNRRRLVRASRTVRPSRRVSKAAVRVACVVSSQAPTRRSPRPPRYPPEWRTLRRGALLAPVVGPPRARPSRITGDGWCDGLRPVPKSQGLNGQQECHRRARTQVTNIFSVLVIIHVARVSRRCGAQGGPS